jgi:Dyp-type peroxidase family
VISAGRGYLDKASRDIIEKRCIDDKRKQPGVAFPSATYQQHLFIIRFDISDHILGNREKYKVIARTGLRGLCRLFDKIAKDEIKINELSDDGDIIRRSLSHFKFSATIGFGAGFFRKLNISEKNTPKRLKAMPGYLELGDVVPYSLSQTDFIIQLGSEEDYINRWIFQNQVGIIEKKSERKNWIQGMQPRVYSREDRDDNDFPDIYAAIKSWARVADFHAGFQRIDGKNLLGFNDGVSNPFRLSNNVIWTTKQDEGEKFKDGTYMAFQKIEHDLVKWQNIHEEKQELWIGRSKGTGLLLGTLSKDDDQKLASEMNSDNELVRKRAMTKWKNLYNQQKFPERKFYDPAETQFRGIQLECPVWSHVRKANPRQADGAANILIFRRGYLFTEDGLNGKSSSGLLFICFQRDIENGFEYIKKRLLNNKNFPVPEQRKNFNSVELEKRFQPNRRAFGGVSKFQNANHYSPYRDFEPNTGKDGLSGPSELGVYPQGQTSITTTLGGGYYFIPPIPNKRIFDISEQFFD